MSSSMKAYLAAKYMSGPKADAILARTSDPTRKKKKRKAGSSAATGVSIIKDDDVGGWDEVPKEEGDEEEDVVVASDRGFKKKQRTDEGSGWATIREGTPPPAADEQPQVVLEEGVKEEEFIGGLLTSAQLRKKLPKKVIPKQDISKEEMEQAQETVYRDATGRKVDMAVERAEAAQRKREAEEREARKMEWGKGLVQREDQEKKRQELETMKNAPFARTVDDVALNEELKAEERWNDPAAAFLTKKRGKGPKKPEYSGPPPPPNRFGIKPGYRWDGVDGLPDTPYPLQAKLPIVRLKWENGRIEGPSVRLQPQETRSRFDVVLFLSFAEPLQALDEGCFREPCFDSLSLSHMNLAKADRRASVPESSACVIRPCVRHDVLCAASAIATLAHTSSIALDHEVELCLAERSKLVHARMKQQKQTGEEEDDGSLDEQREHCDDTRNLPCFQAAVSPLSQTYTVKRQNVTRYY
ncbi:hypothetical protein NM688_g449 [Phlebia brevispora]|uniref:Uncharacterized protein n=1 Tax=Phlebia brevispora TaxID=194682 RepID=A0ACC1TEM2_9APHY|nr:hypothetical protein NM688_g449 [Phlebia brevispora]